MPTKKKMARDDEMEEKFLSKGEPREIKGRLDQRGREVPDSNPMTELIISESTQEDITDKVKRLVSTHISRIAVAQGYESYEEANDLDLEDDDGDDFESPYEDAKRDAIRRASTAHLEKVRETKGKPPVDGGESPRDNNPDESGGGEVTPPAGGEGSQ